MSEETAPEATESSGPLGKAAEQGAMQWPADPEGDPEGVPDPAPTAIAGTIGTSGNVDAVTTVTELSTFDSRG